MIQILLVKQKRKERKQKKKKRKKEKKFCYLTCIFKSSEISNDMFSSVKSTPVTAAFL